MSLTSMSPQPGLKRRSTSNGLVTCRGRFAFASFGHLILSRIQVALLGLRDLLSVTGNEESGNEEP